MGSPEQLNRPDSPQRAAAPAQPWFAVGTTKVFILTVASLGLYAVFWIDRQYRFQQRLTGENVWPLIRGIFGIFFVQDIFLRVTRHSREAGILRSWSASSLASSFVGSTVLGGLVQHVVGKLGPGSESNWLALMSMLLVVGLAYPLAKAQETINELLRMEHPEHDRNERFSGWNFVVIAFGGVLLLSTLVQAVAPSAE
ncbi:MAG: hypothetical protein HY791_30095 [Deltaproteobacteria bacterium]|nr:hypothetical protein [Deltaproteobacteria bacterium]